MRLVMGVAILGAVMLPSTLEAQSRPAALVGTWRVVRFCDQDSTGAMVDPLGELRPFYFGYFGTYSILSDSTVVHHVQGGTLPDYIGTDQPRRYSIRGDTLSIGAPPFPCRVLI